jgi:hypothetical protein
LVLKYTSSKRKQINNTAASIQFRTLKALRIKIEVKNPEPRIPCLKEVLMFSNTTSLWFHHRLQKKSITAIIPIRKKKTEARKIETVTIPAAGEVKIFKKIRIPPKINVLTKRPRM